MEQLYSCVMIVFLNSISCGTAAIAKGNECFHGCIKVQSCALSIAKGNACLMQL